MKKCKRKKAMIGSILGAVGTIVSGAIQANRERKFMEEQQQYQNKVDAINQAAALTTAANNQEHVDAFKDKITLRGGGKYKKVNNKDRITKERQFKCGGRKKYYTGGGSIPVTTSGVTVSTTTPPTTLNTVTPSSGGTSSGGGSSMSMGGGIAGEIIGGVMNAGAQIAVAAMQPKKRIIKSEGNMNFTNTDVKEQKDYQVDANGNVIQPQPQDNINNTIQTNPVAKPQNAFAVDRPSSARLGIKKYKKRK